MKMAVVNPDTDTNFDQSNGVVRRVDVRLVFVASRHSVRRLLFFFFRMQMSAALSAVERERGVGRGNPYLGPTKTKRKGSPYWSRLSKGGLFVETPLCS